jgi:hypothetical protein
MFAPKVYLDITLVLFFIGASSAKRLTAGNLKLWEINDKNHLKSIKKAF